MNSKRASSDKNASSLAHVLLDSTRMLGEKLCSL
jgi:hypothetical protein